MKGECKGRTMRGERNPTICLEREWEECSERKASVNIEIKIRGD